MLSAACFLLLVGWVSAGSKTLKLDKDTDPRFTMSWEIKNNNITIEMKADTKGWVGWGISPNGDMADADLVIGWVNSTGSAFLYDFHADDNTRPKLDEHQDYELLSGKEEGNFTILKFRRKLSGLKDGDDKDIPIEAGKKVNVIFALHEEDPEADNYENLGYHGEEAENRGTKAVTF